MNSQAIEGSASIEAAEDARMVGRLKAVSTVLLLVLAATSFAAGVPGLLAAGEVARLGGLAWLVPIVVDGGLVFFAASAMAWRAETAQASPLGWSMVGLLTATSIAAQVVHVLDGAASFPTVSELVGASVAAMFPLLVLASTRQFEMLRFGRVIEREAVRVELLNRVKLQEQERAAKHLLGSARSRGESVARGAARRVTNPHQVVVDVANAVEGTTQGPTLEEQVRDWIIQADAVGERPTAAAVADRLGRSRATGLRFVNKTLASPRSPTQLRVVDNESGEFQRARTSDSAAQNG